jgi:hypothetical protein
LIEPPDELADGPRVGGARVRVLDARGEELDEAPARPPHSLSGRKSWSRTRLCRQLVTSGSRERLQAVLESVSALRDQFAAVLSADAARATTSKTDPTTATE